MIRRRHTLLVASAAVFVLAAGVSAAPYPNSAPITIPALGAASPYPSPITVAGETNVINKATVTITNFNHGGSADDVDVLFVSPTGDTVMLMSDAGGFNAVTNRVYTFDQTVLPSLNDGGPPSASGTYKPSNYGPTAGCTEPADDTMPAPAPAGPYGSSLNSLLNDAPNGVYNLYVADDCAGDAGSIQGGWTVTLTTGPPTAVALRSFTAAAYSRSVALRWHTGSEAGVLGFNVFRTSGTRTLRVNRALIRAKAAGTIATAGYTLVDRNVLPRSSYTYRLEAVQFSGTRVPLGTAGVRTAG